MISKYYPFSKIIFSENTRTFSIIIKKYSPFFIAIYAMVTRHRRSISGETVRKVRACELRGKLGCRRRPGTLSLV